MRLSKGPVLVVGAGLAGLCLARELALMGRTVTLFSDPQTPAASRAAVGLLQIAGGRISRTHLALRRACWEGYGDFLRALRIPQALRYAGHLRLGELSSVNGFASTLRGLGLEATALTADQVRELEPSLHLSNAAAALLPAATLDPDLLLAALTGCLSGLGVRFVASRIVARSHNGLQDEHGQRWHGSCVVLAGGRGLGPLSGLGWNFREEPGWAATFRGAIPFCHSIQSTQAKETIVPLSSEHWKIGGNGEWGPQQPSLVKLLKGRGQEVSRLTGTRVTAPDGLPVVGAIERRVYLLGGLGRNGMLTAPLLATGLAEQITTGVAPSWLAPFSPQRPEVGRRRSWSH